MDITLVAAFVLGIIAVGRGARLLVHDDFPPAAWLRRFYVRHVHGAWEDLFLCPFCIAPYLAAGNLTWFLLSEGWVRDAWWIVNVWAAVSYLAAILVAYDQPE